jgi:phosphoribosylaminoimidazole-succinocarboxamide synthase
MAPVECVVRGYLAGSGWKEYQASRSVCGIRLPEGLQGSSRLPEPIFTPARKAQTGHDENVPFTEVENMVGRETAAQLRDLSLAIYRSAAGYAATRGILLADTKFEFGRDPRDSSGRLLLGDEVLTPDSSRFWPANRYQPGRAQESYDKQYVRDYLEKIGWNKQAPGPELPEDVVAHTRGKYRSAYEQLTGHALPDA